MVSLLKNFGKSFKDYIDYIVKVSFGELIFHFFELLILILIALFVYIPLSVLEDVIWSLISLFNTDFSGVFTVVCNVINALVALFAFIYVFNKRYEDIKNAPKGEKKEKVKEKDSKKQDVELPKMKDE